MAAKSSETSSSSAELGMIRKYSDGPPWIFKGRALYQFHAVKSSVARRFIPPELKLVEAFGYTLGGLFLAHYDGSPAGEFDEAVVIAGIVWNAPTSCAWAASILVGSEEARIHGRQEVGLPNQFANFTHSAKPLSNVTRPRWDARAWLDGARKRGRRSTEQHSVKIVPRRDGGTNSGSINSPLCHIVGIPCLFSPSSPGEEDRWRWRGPAVQLHLPNFSGKTKEQPCLLKYTCALKCRFSMVSPARVLPVAGEWEKDRETADVMAILTGKPLAAILFDDMLMSAGAPKLVHLKADDEAQRKEATGHAGLPSPTSNSAAS